VTDLLERAILWLEGQRVRHLGRQVYYQRGTGSVTGSVTVIATLGRSTFELDDGAGAVLRVESRDFIVSAADLVLDGQLIEPRSGDRIIQAVEGTLWVYEVTAIGGEPAWRWCDPYHRAMRIHTKQIDREETA
jgi:hypothetical protein